MAATSYAGHPGFVRDEAIELERQELSGFVVVEYWCLGRIFFQSQCRCGIQQKTLGGRDDSSQWQLNHQQDCRQSQE